MHFTAATTVAVLAAAQPALAVVDFHIGMLTWGNFGTGAQSAQVALLDKKNGHACDAIDVGQKYLQNPRYSLGESNWVCKDCSIGKDFRDWSPTFFQVSADKLDADSKYITVRKNDGDWRVFDDSNKKLGECTELNGSSQECTKGLDIYNVFRFMRCEGIARI